MTRNPEGRHTECDIMEMYEIPADALEAFMEDIANVLGFEGVLHSLDYALLYNEWRVRERQ